ncbi:MAG TPA: hypothetical protein VFU49_22980 [Ktedonobacteraceae bacterium]|nr:hypothetical protein [Ktedonobacteraceae bacterium]
MTNEREPQGKREAPSPPPTAPCPYLHPSIIAVPVYIFMWGKARSRGNW